MTTDTTTLQTKIEQYFSAGADAIGDAAAMIYQGRIIWSGPASGLMDSGNPIVDQFTHGSREGPIQMELRR